MLPALDQSMLEAMQALYTPMLIGSCFAAMSVGLFGRRFKASLIRCGGAILLVAAIRTAIEGPFGVLGPVGHGVLDFGLLMILTMPPRRVAQAVLGALAFGQCFLDIVWFMDIFPAFARWHWFMSTSIGLMQFAVLFGWSIGGDGNARRWMVALRRRAARVGLEPVAGRYP